MNESSKYLIKHIKHKMCELQYFVTPRGVLGLANILPIVRHHCEFQLTSYSIPRASVAQLMEGERMLE